MGWLGFARRWIDLIMMCVKLAKYAIIVNGSPMGRIIPSRGIRQGDPISPYLFLLCVKALSSFLKRRIMMVYCLVFPHQREEPGQATYFSLTIAYYFAKPRRCIGDG